MLRFSEMEQKARFGPNSNSSTNQDDIQQKVSPKITPKVTDEPKKRRPIKHKGKPGRPPRGRGRGLNRVAKLVGRRGRFPWRVGRHQVARRGKSKRVTTRCMIVLMK